MLTGVRYVVNNGQNLVRLVYKIVEKLYVQVNFDENINDMKISLVFDAFLKQRCIVRRQMNKSLLHKPRGIQKATKAGEGVGQ